MSSKRRPRSSTAIALTVLGSLERSNAFLVVAQPAAVSTATGANSQRRQQQQQQQQQSCYAPVDNVPGGVLGGRLVRRDWRGCSGRVSRHVLHLEPEDRDLAFELLEAYIERESDSGGREDYDRIRGLVPHMRKRLWKAPSKQQDKMTEELGMDDFQFATKEYVPGLASHPWWEPGQFPWARQLEEASSAIQEEYRALRAREESESQFKNSKEGGYTSQGWTHIPLVNSREPQELYASQRAHFPKTLQILKDLGILANARAVLIGRQRPMSGIKMHSDGSNVIITCHLGLDVPGDEECLMWVGVDMERRAWRNNKLLCMDTSYLHWTRNNTDQERIILLVMVWHPDITPKEKKVLQYLDSLIEHASAGKPLPHHPPIMVEES